MNYEEQIKQTLDSVLDNGIRQGGTLALKNLLVTYLECQLSGKEFDIEKEIELAITGKKPMTLEQYAKDATADHNTSEQFPNV